MKRIITQLFMFSVLVFTLTACSKYEEGSNFTLLTKKARMVNSWKVLKITSDGVDITSANLITEVDIRKNGGITVRGELFGIPNSSEGAWVFSPNKSQIIITGENGNISAYDIIKLKKDELKVSITENDVFTIHEYVSK
tara:strand:- start:798 stop:1214 length:417 start_codon:yes stop_codon:yes gene_type:complete